MLIRDVENRIVRKKRIMIREEKSSECKMKIHSISLSTYTAVMFNVTSQPSSM
jgi:hypothetical protein